MAQPTVVQKIHLIQDKQIRRTQSDSMFQIIEDYVPPEVPQRKIRSVNSSPISPTNREQIQVTSADSGDVQFKHPTPKPKPIARSLEFPPTSDTTHLDTSSQESLPEPISVASLGMYNSFMMDYYDYALNEKISNQLQNLQLISKKTAVQLGQFGWKMYDYVENMLGKPMNSEKITEMDYTSKTCPECESSSFKIRKVLTDVLHGYRACGLCAHTFCYEHTSLRIMLSLNDDNNQTAEVSKSNRNSDYGGIWINVCKRCYDKGKLQSVGQTRDRTSLFVEKRAKKNNLLEQKQDKLVRKLEKISKEPIDDQKSGIWTTIKLTVPSLTSSGSGYCNICKAEYSTFWNKQQSCELCSAQCCSSCCKYNVPLTQSLLNPNGPPNHPNDITVCKACWELLQSKMKRIKFSQTCSSAHVTELQQQYQFTSDLKKEVDKQLSSYMERAQILESSIYDDYELIDDTGANATIHFSDSVRTETQQQLEKLIPIFLEYQKNVKKLLALPFRSEKEQKILNNLKVAFIRSQSNTKLPKCLSDLQQ